MSAGRARGVLPNSRISPGYVRGEDGGRCLAGSPTGRRAALQGSA